MSNELEEFGLIQLHRQNGVKYIDFDHFHKVEKILRFYNELKINKEGIEIVLELLTRLD